MPSSNDIAAERLARHGLVLPKGRRPADVVARFGAVQAQEYPAARRALGLRLADGVTDTAIQRSVDEGRILRTHLMRPTWHFVTRADIRWMLTLTAPQVFRAMGSYFRALELDEPLRARATAAFERALSGRRYLTRPELGDRLASAGIAARGVRLALLTMHAELVGVMCSGPWRGKQLTYALVDDRAPRARERSRDESLAELAGRFLASHGPATIRDFVWWSGLKTPDARRAFDISRARSQTIDGLAYWSIGPSVRPARRQGPLVQLLPIYDEYTVAYRDRLAVPHDAARLRPASGEPVTFQHALVIDGRIAGTWKTPRRVSSGADGASPTLAVRIIPLRRLSAAEHRALRREVLRYARFLGASVEIDT